MKMKKKSILMASACLPLIISANKAGADNRLQYSAEDANTLTTEGNANVLSFTFSHGGRIGATLTAKDPYTPSERHGGGEFGADGINKKTGTIYDETGYTQSGWASTGYNSETGTIYDEEGYNKSGYNSSGYDRDGYNKSGWNAEGINRETGTQYDANGFDRNGYNADGYNSRGFNRQGYNEYGYNASGYNSSGANLAGFKSNGRSLDTNSTYNSAGFRSNGTNRYTGTKYDSSGYDYRGFDANGIHKDTGTQYDANGFDKNGYTADGYNSKGFNSAGYNDQGYNSSGYNSDGYNYQGYNSSGYDHDGYNSAGWNANGINKETGTEYDVNGWSKSGINEETGTAYDANGYNKSGWDQSGYDSAGFNSSGWSAEGINRQTGTLYNTSGYDISGYDAQGYDYSGWSSYGNNYATGTQYDAQGYDKDGYDVNGDWACADNECGAWYETSRNGGYCYYDSCCFAAGTPITLADGSTKPVEEITYDDDLLVWDFDEGKFASAKPLWIKIPEVSPMYEYARFSDGSVLKTINQHRVFNAEAGKFTYAATDDTPLGTHTLNAKGELVELVEKKIVKEEVTYYNIETFRHINCFAGGVLTSNRLNNLYPIKDLKFVKDNRKIVPYEEFADKIERKWYDGYRLGEQPKEINREGDIDMGDRSLIEYVLRSIDIMA